MDRTNNNGIGTIRLRWRDLEIDEWREIPADKRRSVEILKGKKNPPIRRADIPGRYFIDFYNGGKRGTKNINLRTTYDAHTNDETERVARQVAVNYGDMEWSERHRFEAKAKGQVPFLEFFKSLVQGKHWSWIGILRLLQSYPLMDVPLEDIDMARPVQWIALSANSMRAEPSNGNRSLGGSANVFGPIIRR